MSVAVILDPYRPYALMLMEELYRRHGIQSICLHSDWRTRIVLEGRLPFLRSKAVAAHHMISGRSMEHVAEVLRPYEVLGVLPYEEGMLGPLARLAQLLDLPWAQPEVLPAFRDKHALKCLIRERNPRVRLNAFREVATPQDVMQFAHETRLSRFVLKPNDGSGNNGVAFFDVPADPAQLSEYFRTSNSQVLMEEFVAGDEYWINGQMDADGQPTIVGIGTYIRVSENGVQNLEIGSLSVSSEDPVFEPLRRYTEDVMQATGLRRSPFHLEAIVDERGPCLVEVGARLCGELVTLSDQWQHGPQLDLIAVAAHYYTSSRPCGDLPLDWGRYDTHYSGHVTGVSASDQRLTAIHGVTDLEESSHFLWWVKKPHVGDHVQRTTSLTTRAWSAAVHASSEEQIRDVITSARESIRLVGTTDTRWTPRERWPVYRAVLGKAWSSRPRPYQLRALAHR
ncbi:MAG: ATP-grasp domain-containing protein [Candidatus Nanopelagicales bacterium]